MDLIYPRKEVIGRDAEDAAEEAESSTDEDFNPDDADPEAKEGGEEEFDSDAAERSTDSEDRSVSCRSINRNSTF